MRCISLTRLLSNSAQERPNNEKDLDRCVLGKKKGLWLYLSIMQHLASWMHSGECSRAIESLSDCVRLRQGWCDFVTEYWTSLCDLRQKTICAMTSGAHRREVGWVGGGGVVGDRGWGGYQFLWPKYTFSQVLDLFLNVHPLWADAGNKMPPLNLNYEPKPPWGFKYGSPQSPLLLEVLSSNRWASTPCAARHWDLINVGEGRHHRGNGDTCHRSNTGLSVTDKYPP